MDVNMLLVVKRDYLLRFSQNGAAKDRNHGIVECEFIDQRSGNGPETDGHAAIEASGDEALAIGEPGAARDRCVEAVYDLERFPHLNIKASNSGA
jgi:hypothetical protein